MIAYRLGNVAFVMLDAKLVLMTKFETLEEARKAVKDFNAGNHNTIGSY